MDIDTLNKKIDEQGVKIDAIYKTVSRMRRYFLIATWVTIGVIVLPVIGLVFAIPFFMANYVDSLSVLGL